MFPQSYEGRDVMARLSVKLGRTVLTNSVDIEAVGDSVAATTPIFGGNTLVTTTFTGGAPYSPSAPATAAPSPATHTLTDPPKVRALVTNSSEPDVGAPLAT